MTNSNDRLDRMEAIVESNSRVIQAMLDDRASDRLKQEEFFDELRQIFSQAAEERAELRRATIGIANLLGSLDEDRPTILKRLRSIEDKVDLLLEQDANGDEPQQ